MADSNTDELFEDQEEEDGESLDSTAMSKAVVYATDWTTETLLSQLRRGNIEIHPSFQRRDAWTRPRKSKFIESLILGLPVPQIVLAERKEKKGQFIVLDGKQRLLTLWQFIGAATGKNNRFPLTSLPIRQDLNQKSYSDFEQDPTLGADLDSFQNQTIHSVVIRNWPNPDFLHTVFVRLNTESVSLSPQELRGALFPGPFVDYADQRAADSAALKRLLKIDDPDFRMRDVEILVRFLAFSFFLPEYNGNLKAFLDSTCKKLNASWEHQEDDLKARVNSFEAALDCATQIFKENVGHKWTKAGYEKTLNRAVLDVLTFYFADPKIRERSLTMSSDVEKAFKKVSELTKFRASVETTTKSLGATGTRFSMWGEELRKVLKLDYNVPKLSGSRIKFTSLWN